MQTLYFSGIELKVTDKEMQAVDNAAFKEDSTDPKTTNQDPLHLTKV